jgi:hypothetical protein
VNHLKTPLLALSEKLKQSFLFACEAKIGALIFDGA